MLASAIHKALLLTHAPAYRRFRAALENPRLAQEEALYRILAQIEKTEAGRAAFKGKRIRSYNEFVQTFPITDYSHWSPWIEKQRAQRGSSILTLDCRRFEPTSGSTDSRKWIPYSKALLGEFDAAASSWLFDLSRRYPVARGRHYWSLSWLPNELRDELADFKNTSDAQVFPAWKRALIDGIMAVPSIVSSLPSVEESLTATLVYLAACRDLTLISVWSPTFLLEMIEDLRMRRREIARVLAMGEWKIGSVRAPRSSRAAVLLESWNSKSDPDFFSELWPDLSLISCWDSSTSAQWAERVRDFFPKVPLQGKGLWATEGVVSIPFEGKMPAAITSHFLEFKSLQSGQIHPVWELSEGDRVQPLLTTGGGLIRYSLQDQLEVLAPLARTPCLRFVGRLNGIDLVGEKMDMAAAAEILGDLSSEFGVRCVSLLARTGNRPDSRPGYFLLVDGEPAVPTALAARVEERLKHFHHYKLARELGQLAEASVISRPDAIRFYHDLRGDSVALAGARKIESLTLWRTPPS